MGWVWDLLRVRSAFDLDVSAPVGDVVRRLRSRVLPSRPSVLSGREGYAGEVTERGFAVRRFGRALIRGESRICRGLSPRAPRDRRHFTVSSLSSFGNVSSTSPLN